jgi:hypothetical protein
MLSKCSPLDQSLTADRSEGILLSAPARDKRIKQIAYGPQVIWKRHEPGLDIPIDRLAVVLHSRRSPGSPLETRITRYR